MKASISKNIKFFLLLGGGGGGGGGEGPGKKARSMKD